MATLDFGDSPRGSLTTKTFRVKNLSTTLTANTVRVAMDANTDSVPSQGSFRTLSYGGGADLAQVTIGNIAPGAISGVVTLKQNVPLNAALSLWWGRVFTEAISWSP